MLKQACVSLICAGFFFAVSGAESVTIAQKAERMVNKGAAYVKQVGKDSALVEFNDPKGKFIDGDLYIFAYTMKHVCLALPFKPAQVGKDLSELVDADGKPFFQEFSKVLTEKGSGWVDYKWNNPLTKKIQDKTSFVMKIDGENLYIGCGFYK
jgi:cytochrome c